MVLVIQQRWALYPPHELHVRPERRSCLFVHVFVVVTVVVAC